MSADTGYRLLMDMDSLMDTRMGTLIRLRPDISKVLDLMTYRKRETDNYGELTDGAVSTEAFKELYSKRDTETLKASVITGILPIVDSYIVSLQERLYRKVDIGSIDVYLNLHPYVLSGPELEEVLDILRLTLPPYAKISAVRERPEDLTPDLLSSRYNGWITYDFNSWLEHHHETLLFRPINEMTVIIPRLLHGKPGEDMGEIEDDPFKDADKHGLFAMVMEDYVHLELLDVEDYCFLIPGTYQAGRQSSPPEETDETKSS